MNEPLLELRGLSITFGGLKAVSGLDYELPRGMLGGLIGPNGAGKTTVFNLLTGFLAPDACTAPRAGPSSWRGGPSRGGPRT